MRGLKSFVCGLEISRRGKEGQRTQRFYDLRGLKSFFVDWKFHAELRRSRGRRVLYLRGLWSSFLWLGNFTQRKDEEDYAEISFVAHNFTNYLLFD
jgi:hypothetical protein